MRMNTCGEVAGALARGYRARDTVDRYVYNIILYIYYNIIYTGVGAEQLGNTLTRTRTGFN